MQILVKLATVILPIILNFLSKHESEILDKLFKKFGFGNNELEIYVYNENGELLPNAVVVAKKVVKDNKVDLSKITQISIVAKGYKDQNVVINDTDSKVEVIMESVVV